MGAPGVSAYQVPRKQIKKQLKISDKTIQTVAREYRKAFGFNESGKPGGAKIGTIITPKELIFQEWQHAATTSRKISVDDIIIRAGKNGILISPSAIHNLVVEFNKYLDPQARVKVHSGAVKINAPLEEIRLFLEKNGITGTKSARRGF